MEAQTADISVRRPRFRRAPEPPPFRLTDDDVLIIRQLARYRFLRSTHIAALVGRSLDRTNDRLLRLFHAGYLDRPRAQLDYYPTAGSAPIAYALADRGARLLANRYGAQLTNVAWTRKNREAGRPFIEHQLETIDFWLGLHAATADSPVQLIHQHELIADFPERQRARRNPLSLTARLSHRGHPHEISVIPDLAFGLVLPDGSRRNFLVEIDRGTMPVTRSDMRQTSVERKLRAYLAAHAARQHQRQFGWKNFRVLTVTTDHTRLRSMTEATRQLRQSGSSSLFLFATRNAVARAGPIATAWHDIRDRRTCLI